MQALSHAHKTLLHLQSSVQTLQWQASLMLPTCGLEVSEKDITVRDSCKER